MFKKIISQVEILEKTLRDELKNGDLISFVMQAIQEDCYTRKINEEYEVDCFFANETFSHTIRFKRLKTVKIRQVVIDYQLMYEDIHGDLVFDVFTTNEQYFIIKLKLNHDFSVYDIEYFPN